MRPRRPPALWILLAGNTLTMIGVTLFLPMLPLFLGAKGGSAAVVGAVFAAGILARALVQYPAGLAADRFGSRPVMVAAMVAYALLFFTYLLPLPPLAFIAVRFVHSSAGGSFGPAANALLADLTPSEQRGRAFGLMQSTTMAGLLIGPTLGGLVAGLRLDAVFGAAALVSLAAAVVLLALPRPPATRATQSVHATPEPPLAPAGLVRKLLPLMLIGAAFPYLIGTYDTIWSLYVTYRGANTVQVGLSFALFALPSVLLSSRSGALADRIGAKRLMMVGLVGAGFFAALYPFITSVPLLILLGVVEGLFTLNFAPALLSEVSRTARPGQQGRTQGFYQAVTSGVQIAGSLIGGALYTLGPAYAFLGISLVCGLSLASALIGPTVVRTRERAAAAPGIR